MCTYFTLGNCQDLNISKKKLKILKISQEDAILIKNLYLSKQYCARRLLSELPDNGWKLGSIDSMLKRIRIARRVQMSGNQAAADRVRRVAVEELVPSQEDKLERHRSARENFAWNWHSPFKCAQDNSPWSPAQMLQTTSCSAVVWSQSHLPSQTLIKNLIVCNKACYCFILNRKLCNK